MTELPIVHILDVLTVCHCYDLDPAWRGRSQSVLDASPLLASSPDNCLLVLKRRPRARFTNPGFSSPTTATIALRYPELRRPTGNLLAGLAPLDDRAKRVYRPRLAMPMSWRAAARGRREKSVLEALNFVAAKLFEFGEAEVARFVAELEQGLKARGRCGPELYRPR